MRTDSYTNRWAANYFAGWSLIVLLLLLPACVVIPAVGAQPQGAGDASVRPCKLQPRETAAAAKPAKKKKGKAGGQDANPGEACLEVRASPLEAQERLQAFVREQPWQVGEAEISESSWSFSIELSDKELLEYTTPDFATKRVNWTRGKAVVLVRTVDLGDSFARTTVTAKFEGFGESDDEFAIKRASWPLASNGRLEAMLTGALQPHSHANP